MKPNGTPTFLIIIAGKGVYPRLLAESARAQGVQRIFALAFYGETHPDIARYTDRATWVKVGRLTDFLEALRSFRSEGADHAVMVGQITPTLLFHARPDKAMFALIRDLKKRNAETICGAVGEAIAAIGIQLQPAHLFMESAMPEPGVLSAAAPDQRQSEDIALGLLAARAVSELDIGQTVVVKAGTILAVEAFEGTDRTILRASRLGGRGCVVVKVAKQNHDMRFDIPVVGLRTMKTLKKARAAVLALEARRTILLEREAIIRTANRLGLVLTAVE